MEAVTEGSNACNIIVDFSDSTKIDYVNVTEF